MVQRALALGRDMGKINAGTLDESGQDRVMENLEELTRWPIFQCGDHSAGRYG